MKEGSPAEIVQATQIYQTIGVYLGYATAQFREFYDFNYFLILGRVTKGAGAHACTSWPDYAYSTDVTVSA
jgi:hypothetical protein